jgi:ABC-2 type transport system permease protein
MPDASWPPTTRLVVEQVVSQVKVFLRIPIALFFTIGLPVMMLVLFNALFGGAGATVETATGDWSLIQFYVGALAAFSAVSATFTNLANMIPANRQDGVMKRWRGTPLPRWVYLAGFVGSALLIAVCGLVLVLGLGFVAYDLDVNVEKLPAAAVSFVVGTLAFSALGAAVAGLIRSHEAAPAVTNGIILPLAFISNTFVAIDESEMPRWLDVVSGIFPLRPFVESMQAAFNPTVGTPGLLWDNLAVVSAWGVAGVILAVRCFKWEPVADTARPRRPRARRTANPSLGSEVSGVEVEGGARPHVRLR